MSEPEALPGSLAESTEADPSTDGVSEGYPLFIHPRS